MDTLHLVQFAPPRFPSEPTADTPAATSASATVVAAGSEGFTPTPSDAVRTFAFMANLYAQEVSGDPAASASPERVLHRLRGSNESQTYIFALIQGSSPLGEVSELGETLIPSTGEIPDYDYAGFIHISTSLLEEKDTADLDFVLDVGFLPLPGEEIDEESSSVASALVHHGLALAQKLGRTTYQASSLHSDDTPADADPFSNVYRQAGFSIKHAERQVRVEVPLETATVLVPTGLSTHSWLDYDIPGRYLDDVIGLLTVASEDSLTGDLSVEPIQWNRTRLAEAHARLRSRKAHTLMVALIDEKSGKVVALTELGRHAGSDPEVAEWTLTVTARERRNQQLASIVKQLALTALREHWPEVERTYASIGFEDAAMNRIFEKLSAEGISRSESWELLP